MNRTKLLTAAVAALVLLGGVAAIGAGAPTAASNGDQYSDDAETDADDADSGVDDDATNASAANETNASAANGTGTDAMNTSVADSDERVVGPPGGLPAQVPDHVSGIHSTIEGFLDGSVDNLGAALSDLAGGDSSASDDSESDGDDAQPDGAANAPVDRPGPDAGAPGR